MINPINAYERIKTEVNTLKSLSETDKLLISACVMNCLIDEMSWQQDQDHKEKKRALTIASEIL